MADGKGRGWLTTLVVGFILGGVAVWWFMSRVAGPPKKEFKPPTPVSHCTNHPSQSITLHVRATCPGAVDQDPVALCPGDKITWTKEPPEQSRGVDTFTVQFTTPKTTPAPPTWAPLQDPNSGKDKTTFGDNEVGFAKIAGHISNFPSDGYFEYSVTVNPGPPNGGQPCYDPGVIIVR
jgi:hypothetical protein